MEKVKIGKEAKIVVKWKVLQIDYSKEAEDNLIAKMSKKYGVPKDRISVEPVVYSRMEDGEEVPFSDETISGLQDPLFQQNMFPKYIAEKGIEGYDMDKIVEIDNTINAMINYEAYDKHRKYTIKWIKWSNFMSYGPDNYFDFTNLKGLVLLSSEPANQGGKTTFCLDLFRFLLFGKVTSREDDWTLARAFNDHIPEATECVVEGCINIDGTDYVVKRTLSRPALSKRTEKSKTSQKVNYYKIVNNEYIDLVDEDDIENEAGTSTRETNKFIKESIGNERDFDLMICITSKNLEDLISLKDTDRGRLIARWVGLLPLEEKDKLAREKFNKTVVPSLYLNKYNKEELKQTIEDTNTENEILTKEGKKVAKSVEDSDKKIQGFREKRDILLQSKRSIDDELTKTDKATVEQKKEELTGLGIKKSAEKKENEVKLAVIKDIEFNEADYQAKIQEDKEEAISLNSMRNELIQCQKDIEALKKGEFCPTCGAKLKDVDNSDAIAKKEERIDELTKNGKKLKAKLDKLSKEIENLNASREKYNEKLRLQLIIEKNEVDIENLRSQLRECNRILKDMEKNDEAIRKNNEIDAQINIIDANISEEDKIKRENESWLEDARATLKANNKIIVDSTKIVEIIEQEEVLVRNWKIYLDMVGKNGISKMVLRNALPMINEELKRLLNGVCDFIVEVAIDEHNDVTFYRIHDGVKAKLASGSGFEQTVASLALRSALSKFSSFSKPSFVIFDEILGAIADENYDTVKLLYDKIVKDYQFIFQITHLKAIADWHDSNVIVKKNNNISTIEMV